jgi:hypothetical protein
MGIEFFRQSVRLRTLALVLLIGISNLFTIVVWSQSLSTSSGGTTFFKGSSSGIVVDASLTVNGSSSVKNATVRICNGFKASEDLLIYPSTLNGITGSYASSTGILTLSGTATTAQYQQALRTIQYRNINASSESVSKQIIFSLGEAIPFTPTGSSVSHFYKYVASTKSWVDAKTEAQNTTYFGLNGYLSTISSSEENSFITQKLHASAYIGASDSGSEGIWQWVCGPEAGTTFFIGNGSSGTTVNGKYSNWNLDEPNNEQEVENYACIYGPSRPAETQLGYWSDVEGSSTSSGNELITGYILEFGGSSDDPVVSIRGDKQITLSSVDAPSSLSYSPDSIVAIVNSTEISVMPSFVGTVSAFSVSPALPSGITLNSATGVISGKPTVTSLKKIYTITASNMSGNATASIVLSVNDVPPSALSYPASPVVAYLNNTNISAAPSVLGNVSAYSVTPSLPAGVGLNVVTGLISGVPTEISSLTEFTVTATNSGGSTNAVFKLVVNNTAPSISYPASPVVATVHSSFSATPSLTGNVVSYSITPALPAGVFLNTSTGVISGSSTVVSPLTEYIVTASNSGGSASCVFKLTVLDVPPSSLSYPNSPIVSTVNTTTIYAAPIVTGDVSTYSITPELPSGVSLNATTGIIQGKPTVTSALKSYTVTAANSGGSTSVVIQLTVNGIAPSSLSYPASPVVATLNTAISVTPVVTGSVVSYSITPSLPAGLILNTTTGVVSGTPLLISPLTDYIVTASNSGGNTTAVLKLSVSSTAPASLYYPASPVMATINKTNIYAVPSVTGTVYSYSISPDLPAGVSLDATTGVVSGIPTELLLVTDYTVTAINPRGSATTSFQLSVNDVAPTNLSYPVNPVVASINAALSVVPTVSGNAVGYTITPTLPVGLNLSASDGSISGIPTMVSPLTEYLVSASNSGGSATTTLKMMVKDNPPASLSYSPNSLTATVNSTDISVLPVYSGNITNFSVAPALPSGVTLNASTGEISGRPVVSSSRKSYLITASNSGGSITASFELTVNSAPPSALTYQANAIVATILTTNVYASPSVTGTVSSYSISPTLPAGVIFNTSTGVISGIPTVLLPITDFTITATNSGGSISTSLKLSVNNIAPTSLKYQASPVVATVNTNLSVSPSVTGSDLLYSISPALPAGLSLNTATGQISGIPTEPIPLTDFLVTASNSGGSTNATLKLTVNNMAPERLSYPLSSIVVTVNSTITPLTPSVSGSGLSFTVYPALPDGMSLDETTGVLSGTPTEYIANTLFKVVVSNSGGSTSSTFSLSVTPEAPTTVSEVSLCSSGTIGNLVAIPPTDCIVIWYDAAVDGNRLDDNTVLSSGTTYYAESSAGSIVSQNRSAVLVTLYSPPAKPALVAKPTSDDAVLFCPGDAIECTNYDASLSYKWKLDDKIIPNATSRYYNVPADGAGCYSLYVKNPITGCESTSEHVHVDLHTVTTPVIYEKKKSDNISILIVDNTQNLYAGFLWTYADGSPLPAEIVNNRQFLILPPSDMDTTYMVKVIDCNGCSVNSASRAVTLKATQVRTYPTRNKGNFNVNMTSAQEGTMVVKIINQTGLVQKTYSFDHVVSDYSYQIDATSLSSGIYLVEITLGSYKQTQRIIIE